MASKYGVYQEIFSFSEAVKQRYRSDLIMNPVLTIFIVIMPLLVYMLVMAMSNAGGQYDIINDFSGGVMMVMMMIQHLVIA